MKNSSRHDQAAHPPNSRTYDNSGTKPASLPRTKPNGKLPGKRNPAAWNEKPRIPAELLDEASVWHITDEQARKQYNLASPPDQKLDGVVFPCLDRNGNWTGYCRVRLDTPYVDEKGKEHRYHGTSKKRAQRTLYYPPNAKARADSRETTRVLLEAEKSVLALEAWARRTGRTDILGLGMGGCQGYLQKDARGHSVVLPDLDVCDGSKTIVMVDSNWATNSQVRNARDKLVVELNGRQARALVADLPQEKGVNGFDDYCALHTDEEIAALIKSAHVAEVAPYSEQALAQRFVSENKDDVLYVIDVGYHVWDGCRWKMDEELKVDELAHQLCKKAAKECGKPALADRVRSRRMRESILREAQPYLIRSLEKMDADKHLLGTPGGVVDLRTGELRPAERKDYITMLTAVSPDLKSTPVRWLKFLGEVSHKEEELIAYLQRICGYCLTGETREHALFYLDGSGRNGKSTFAETMKELMSDYASTAPISLFLAQRFEEHSTSTACLRGKRMVTASETRVGQSWDEAKLKYYTGGDTLKAKFMRKDEIEFKPDMKLVLLGNHRPRFRNIDEAIRDRFFAIPFRQHFAREDDRNDKGKLRKGSKLRNTKLDLELRKELGAILAWAIRGAKAWYQSGLRTPVIVKQTSEEYLVSQDSVKTWADEKMQPRDKKNKEQRPATLTLMHADYTVWCKVHNEYPKQRDEFLSQLLSLGFRSTKAQRVVTFPEFRLGIPKWQSSGE